MIVHIDSWIASLFMKLPNWMVYVELVRVGTNCTEYVRVGFWR